MASEFREPLLMDEYGLYITTAQMQFYLNEEGGEAKFKRGDPDFIKYYQTCLLYNAAYDLADEYPKDIFFTWNSVTNTLEYSCTPKSFPEKCMLDIIKFLSEDDGEEEEDTFGF